MHAHPIGLHHDKPARANRNKRAQRPNLARIAHAENRGRRETASRVAQGVTNSRTGPDPDHFIAKRRECPRNRRLADARLFNELARGHRPPAKQQADGSGMVRHGGQ